MSRPQVNLWTRTYEKRPGDSNQVNLLSEWTDLSESFCPKCSRNKWESQFTVQMFEEQPRESTQVNPLSEWVEASGFFVRMSRPSWIFRPNIRETTDEDDPSASFVRIFEKGPRISRPRTRTLICQRLPRSVTASVLYVFGEVGFLALMAPFMCFGRRGGREGEGGVARPGSRLTLGWFSPSLCFSEFLSFWVLSLCFFLVLSVILPQCLSLFVFFSISVSLFVSL